MGNQSAKQANQTPFTPEELKILESSFKSLNPHSDKLTKEKLLVSFAILITQGH